MAGGKETVRDVCIGFERETCCIEKCSAVQCGPCSRKGESQSGVTSEGMGHLKRINMITDSEMISQAHTGIRTVGSYGSRVDC